MNSAIFSSKSLYSLGLLIISLILLAILPRFTPAYFVVLMSNIFMYIVLTVSWVIFSGPTRYISLATAAFLGIGVYTSAILGKTLSLPIVIGIGSLASFCLALLVGALTLRLKGIYFAMFTFGLVELVRHLLLWWEIHISYTVGRIVVAVDNTTVYYVMVIIFGSLMFTTYFIKHSKFGLALHGIGQNEEAAAHIGVNVTLVKIIAFAISAIFMGATGAIMATRWTYIDPSIAFNPLYSFLPVLMAIFGGTGQLYGPVLGAAIFSYLQEVLTTRFPYFYMFMFGLILVVAILYLPHGLVGLIEQGTHRLKQTAWVKKTRWQRKEVESA